MSFITAALIGGGASLLGGVMASGAASDAANAQSAAAAASDATQRYMYDQTREDNAPFRDTGIAANNQLAMLMGLPGGESLTRDQMRNSLLSQYTTTTPGQDYGYQNYDSAGGQSGPDRGPYMGQPSTQGTSTINESGLNAAIERQWAEQQQNQLARSSDPRFGSLTRKFGQSDMNADPVYQNGLQFGLNEGTKGINRQAAAGGNFLSGATLKALTRFGNDYGSTKANESYNRFNNDNNTQYNRLAGLSGAGQQATNQIGAAGQNMANQVSQSQQGAGNARASGYVGSANAWNGALGQAAGGYQNALMMNQLFNRPPTPTDMTGFSTPSAYSWPTTNTTGSLGSGTYGV